MGDRVLQIADDYWNVRGSFKIGGVVDIGTHASLVRLGNGTFVFLDAYTMGGDVAQQVDSLTRGGEDVEAILNLHPFHTVHVRRVHKRYPRARLYGTARHLARFPELPWERLRTEDAELHTLFQDDFEFSVPRGVDFISSNENLHFSSVLALHRRSNTIHVDDTLMCLRPPKLVRGLGVKELLSFHPTLSRVLERRPGAANDFRIWANELCERWSEAQNLCAAHSAALTRSQNRGASIPARIRKALGKVANVLRKHETKHG